MRLLRTSLVFGGAVSWLLTLAAIALLLLSRSNPWLVGRQHEPRWSWAVGSGRIKVWVAVRPGAFAPDDSWPAMFYRGLDGEPVRWEVTLDRQAAITVLAIPLWLVALAAAIVGTSTIALGAIHRRSDLCARPYRGLSKHTR